MSALDEIFAEYISMRDNGLEVNQALSTLRGHIDPLAKPQKRELATRLRAWEKTHEKSPAPADPPPESATALQSPAIEPAAPDARWVSCANCGKKNRLDSGFCYACGLPLEQTLGRFATQQFKDANIKHIERNYFGPESVLGLKLRDFDQEFELHPHLCDEALTVGRSTPTGTVAPDVDLSSYDGERLGVSRLHLALKYIPEDHAIQVHDLGSANGSLINGQRLHPSEMRVLSHGDELRLGHMIIDVRFRHPGKEIC